MFLFNLYTIKNNYWIYILLVIKEINIFIIYLLLSVELLIENLEDEPVFIAEYKTNETKIPILTKLSEPKWTLDPSGLDFLLK